MLIMSIFPFIPSRILFLLYLVIQHSGVYNNNNKKSLPMPSIFLSQNKNESAAPCSYMMVCSPLVGRGWRGFPGE